MNRQIQLPAASCTECIKSCRNLKPAILAEDVTRLDTLEEPSQELQLDYFFRLLPAVWAQIGICIGYYQCFEISDHSDDNKNYR